MAEQNCTANVEVTNRVVGSGQHAYCAVDVIVTKQVAEGYVAGETVTFKFHEGRDSHVEIDGNRAPACWGDSATLFAQLTGYSPEEWIEAHARKVKMGRKRCLCCGSKYLLKTCMYLADCPEYDGEPVIVCHDCGHIRPEDKTLGVYDRAH